MNNEYGDTNTKEVKTKSHKSKSSSSKSGALGSDQKSKILIKIDAGCSPRESFLQKPRDSKWNSFGAQPNQGRKMNAVNSHLQTVSDMFHDVKMIAQRRNDVELQRFLQELEDAVTMLPTIVDKKMFDNEMKYSIEPLQKQNDDLKRELQKLADEMEQMEILHKEMMDSKKREILALKETHKEQSGSERILINKLKASKHILEGDCERLNAEITQLEKQISDQKKLMQECSKKFNDELRSIRAEIDVALSEVQRQKTKYHAAERESEAKDDQIKSLKELINKQQRKLNDTVKELQLIRDKTPVFNGYDESSGIGNTQMRFTSQPQTNSAMGYAQQPSMAYGGHVNQTVANVQQQQQTIAPQAATAPIVAQGQTHFNQTAVPLAAPAHPQVAIVQQPTSQTMADSTQPASQHYLVNNMVQAHSYVNTAQTYSQANNATQPSHAPTTSVGMSQTRTSAKASSVSSTSGVGYLNPTISSHAHHASHNHRHAGHVKKPNEHQPRSRSKTPPRSKNLGKEYASFVSTGDVSMLQAASSQKGNDAGENTRSSNYQMMIDGKTDSLNQSFGGGRPAPARNYEEGRMPYTYKYHPAVKAMNSVYNTGTTKPNSTVPNLTNVSNMSQKVPYSSTSVLNPKPGIYTKPTVVSHKPLYGTDTSDSGITSSNYTSSYMKKPMHQSTVSGLGDVISNAATNSTSLKAPSFLSSWMTTEMSGDASMTVANSSAAATYPDLKSKTVLPKYRNAVKEADDMLTEFDEKGDAHIRELKTLIAKEMHSNQQSHAANERSNSRGSLMHAIPEENRSESSLVPMVITSAGRHTPDKSLLDSVAANQKRPKKKIGMGSNKSGIYAGISEESEVGSAFNETDTPMAPRNIGSTSSLALVPELDLGKEGSFQSNEKVQKDLKALDKDIVKLQSSIHSLLSAHN